MVEAARVSIVLGATCVKPGCDRGAAESGLCTPCEKLAEAGGTMPEDEAQWHGLVAMLQGDDD